MAERFNVIIVGAGPAGCTAAYLLAKEGLDVLVIERGEYPGAKNVSGAVLYCKAVHDIAPGFWDDAPIERVITRQVVAFLSDKSSVSLDFKNADYSQMPYNAVTVLRGKFDQWLAKKAQESGALIMNDTLVEDLLWENGRALGVRVGKREGDVLADVVIAADGANSLLAEKATLRRPLSPEHMALGVKELLRLPKETIEERFNLGGDEGVAYTFVGEASQEVEGGAFLYTNKDSLSIGVVCTLSGLAREKKEPASLIESFKAHPMIKGLLEGATLKEYSAHLIPEGGIHMMPKLYSDGILIVGDAAGFTLNTGFNLRGMDFAIASGVMAAKAVIKAREKSDFSRSSLSMYQKFLEDSFVLRDLRNYRKAPRFLRKRSIYNVYPKMICDLAERVYTVDEKPKKKLFKLTLDEVKEKTTMRQFFKDIFEGGRSI